MACKPPGCDGSLLASRTTTSAEATAKPVRNPVDCTALILVNQHLHDIPAMRLSVCYPHSSYIRHVRHFSEPLKLACGSADEVVVQELLNSAVGHGLVKVEHTQWAGRIRKLS
jgi:hypothetical protein